MYGVVTKYFKDRGYGFILSNGITYFLHRKDLNGEYVETGYHVFFKDFKTNRRDYNAAILYVIETPEGKKK